MPKTKEELDAEKSDKEYKDKKDSLQAFKTKHSLRIDKLADIASDIAKRGINHELGLKGEIADKLKIIKDLEEKRNNDINIPAEMKGKYAVIITELEKELLL